MSDEPNVQQVNFDIDWSPVETFGPGKYCNQLLVQHMGEEFVLSFCYVEPPLNPGGQASLPAHVMAKIIVTPAMMQQLVSVTTKNYNRAMEKQRGV